MCDDKPEERWVLFSLRLHHWWTHWEWIHWYVSSSVSSISVNRVKIHLFILICLKLFTCWMKRVYFYVFIHKFCSAFIEWSDLSEFIQLILYSSSFYSVLWRLKSDDDMLYWHQINIKVCRSEGIYTYIFCLFSSVVYNAACCCCWNIQH